MHQQFSIQELAEKAKVTVRTIRYYTEEGLLPPPVVRGKNAYYSLDHLNRLELIRRMKEAYLPLREIRQVMLSLTEAEVVQKLKEQILPQEQMTREVGPAASAPQAGSDAVEYISRLMTSQAAYRPGKNSPASSPSPPMKQVGSLQSNIRLSDTPVSDSVSEVWQRILLASGVELHFRTSLDPNFRDRVEQLISFAIKLFRQPNPGGKK
jgi:DNA-binding transcriptional MerR regulator